MTLRGLLRSFPPLEVLQFLTQSGKTGTLRVYDESDTKLLAFEQGQLLYAIHQRKIPPLVELLIHRDLLSDQKLAVLPVSEKRWDDVVSRALERHRKLSRKHGLEKSRPGPGPNRLGSILLTQGRLTEEQLEAALDPAVIPDKYLKAVLKDAGVIHALELLDSWVGPGVETSLYEAMLERRVLTREEICDAMRLISDESLAEILVYHGSLGRTEAKMCLDQLESLRECILPQIRLGEYMVAKGQISQRQLERALGEQFASRELLGAILVEQGVISEEELEETNLEIAALRADFGPLHSLRELLVARHGLSHTEFARALQQHRASDRLLIDVLAESGKVTVPEVRKGIETVLVRELCDVLIWPEASFEFYEGFSLNKALSHSELPVVHDEPFDLGSLLLVACRDLDELLSKGNRGLSPNKVFVRTAQARTRADDAHVGEKRIVRRLDGRRDLRQVCRVLPGNRLSHFQLFAELTRRGDIEPLPRGEAFYQGTSCVERGEYREALVLFKHALNSPGELPTNYALRVAIQDARLASEKRFLRRALLRFRKLLPTLTKGAFEHGIAQWVKKHSRAGTWLITTIKNARKSCSHLLVQGRLSFENFLMRKGWARNMWALKERLWKPFERLVGRSSARAAVILGVSMAALIVAMTQAIPEEISDPPPDLLNMNAPPVPLRSSMARYELGVPVEMAPTVSENRIYVVSRDGLIRCVTLSSASKGGQGPRDLQLQWEVRVGKYGDILSRPAVADERVFLTNVRGHAFALSSTGETLWRQTLPRLEAMQPTPFYSASGELVGIAVVSRESVYVLDPDHGSVLYRLQTGNHIYARPVGNEEFLVVGSGDTHLYMARWKDSAVSWDHEVSDDIISLILHDNTPIFATRDGGLAAVDPDTGQERWRRAFRRNAIKSLNSTGSGELYIETGRGKIEFILPSSGKTASSFWPDPTLGVSVAGVRDGQYFYASDSGFMGELELTGEPEWRTRETVEEITGWDHGNGFLAVTQHRGDLLIFFTRSRGSNGR